jgi:hypothetical protein
MPALIGFVAMSWLSLGGWIAFAALILAVGKHLDTNYIGNPAREWTRAKLISAFLFLELPLLPRLFGQRAMLVASAMFVILYTWILLKMSALPPAVLDSYFPGQNPRVVQAGLLLSCALISFQLLRNSLFFAESEAKKVKREKYSVLAWRFHEFRTAATRVSLAILPIAYVIGFMMFMRGMSNPDMLISFAYAFLYQAFLYILILAIFFALCAVNYIVILLQRIAQHVFDKASSPKTSPFTYFSELLSLFVLAAKLIQEYLKPS